MDGDIHIESETSAENTGCTPLACVQDDDKYKLECAECKLLVHYRCTQLPLYQIQLFLTKGCRKYICLNCVEVPTYLLELHIVETTSSSHKKTMAELSGQSGIRRHWTWNCCIHPFLLRQLNNTNSTRYKF